MSFLELHFYDEYVSHHMNLVKEFYIPVLSEAVSFDRAVGFFRGDFISQISKGMSALINNNGYLRIITSPELTLEDIEKINQGYELKKLIEQKLHAIIKAPLSYTDQEKANYLAHLIASNRLDIKIALTKDPIQNGIFHEKWGVLTDKNNNKISMVGSNNDTYSGLFRNHESFELNLSWESERDRNKIITKERRFQMMWENLDQSLIVSEFPEELKEEILKYKKSVVISEEQLLVKELLEQRIKESMSKESKHTDPSMPFLPNTIQIRDYQWDAFFKWQENNYRGIFSMATGTGKTIAALNSAIQLFRKKKKLFVIIVCPYQHLVEQWVEDLESFNIYPIIGYSRSKQREWRVLLRNQVRLFNIDKNDKFSCFITTNATYSKQETLSLLSELKGDVLLIVDEAHNIGSETRITGLLDCFNYRLALSATFERKYDEIGTLKLKEYFDKVVYEIDIQDAIYEKKCLVEYEYYPVLCFLTDKEFDQYKELTKRIAIGTKTGENGKITQVSNDAKYATNLRSMLIASAQNKIVRLVDLLPIIKGSKNNLIYCGAAKVSLEDMPELIETDEDELRQVDYVRDLLNDNGIISARFTADEDVDQRILLKEHFSSGIIETLVAIRCLDEGVNIPSIERAFVLASSKDKKQYIQRRGRVLRKFNHQGYIKEKAYIYDFITLPFKADYTLEDEDKKFGKILVEDELERIDEFYASCSNQDEVLHLIEDLILSYNVREEDM